MKTTSALFPFVASALVGAALAQVPQPQVVYPFPPGANPVAPLVLGSDENIYGTTPSAGRFGLGAVFKMTASGVVTTLLSFAGPDGQAPTYAGLISDNAGNLYGTTLYGGTGQRGTVFKLTLDGVLTTLVHFDGTNGVALGGLTRADDGTLYGIAITNITGQIFKLAPDGTFSTIARFPGVPVGGLTFGTDGHLYVRGYNGNSGYGPIFRVKTDGTITWLATVWGCPYVYSTALTQGNDGNFYGTTFNGGAHGVGTVFRMSPAGSVTTLVNFDWNNGALPAGPLTLGPDGNLYGATTYGGIYEGTVFRLTPNGALTTLAHFPARETGVRPYGGVIFGPDGDLYGTTATGGSGGFGTIFKLDLPSFDSDSDGVLDENDQCPETPDGAIVNAYGCSIEQLVPCDGPYPGTAWKNHGHYLVAIAKTVRQFMDDGLLDTEQARAIIADAVHSNCGKPNSAKDH